VNARIHREVGQEQFSGLRRQSQWRRCFQQIGIANAAASAALANKMARMIWAMTTKGENYRMA
jgi:hypothetical protein